MPADKAGEFLGQLADLRGYGPSDPLTGGADSAKRTELLAKVKELRAGGARLSAADTASLGGYLIRLRRTEPGQQDYDEALRVLEDGRRLYPRDFAILANLATVYQLTGRLDAAASCLQDALEHAPPTQRTLERYHFQLLRQRAQEQTAFGLAPLDRLFVGPDRSPVRFIGPSGEWEVGRIADAERAKLPNGSVDDAWAIVKQLLLWFPDDARLLWQYAELANAAGDVKTAAAAMEQAVYIFRLSTPALKERRFVLQEAVAWREVLARAGDENKQLGWLIGALGRGVEPTPAPDLSPSQVSQALTLPRPKDPPWDGPFIGKGGAGPVPPINPFASMGWYGWTAVTVGAVLILGFLILQLRESWRRRRPLA
jgi:tetratricopeptide (TPR) repeat protein